MKEIPKHYIIQPYALGGGEREGHEHFWWEWGPVRHSKVAHLDLARMKAASHSHKRALALNGLIHTPVIFGASWDLIFADRFESQPNIAEVGWEARGSG